MSTYAEIADANEYFAGIVNSSAWDNADSSTQQKALIQATRIIDGLNYDTASAAEDQDLVFPLDGQDEIPYEIVIACCEIAIELLKGFDIEKEMQALAENSSSIGGVSAGFTRVHTSEHILAGVPSYVAWKYLQPYLADMRSVKLERLS